MIPIEGKFKYLFNLVNAYFDLIKKNDIKHMSTSIHFLNSRLDGDINDNSFGNVHVYVANIR